MASNDSTNTVPVGSGREACAACKYQRRKCKDDCLLAPYFPANTPDKFLKVHKLYGVRNVANILKQVEDPFKNDTMQSIIYESEMRHKSPVFGSAGYTMDLVQQLSKATDELEQLQACLALCRARAARANMHQQHSHPSSGETPGANQNLSQTNQLRSHAVCRDPRGNVPAHHQQHSPPLSAETPGANQTMIRENSSETNLQQYWLDLYRFAQGNMPVNQDYNPAFHQKHSHPLSAGTPLENQLVIRESLSDTDLSALIYPGEQDNIPEF